MTTAVPPGEVDRTDTLARALHAERIAVFGASRTPGKFGYIVVEQLLAHGYAGELVLVNPAGGTCHGLPLQESSAAAGADVAVIALPAAHVADAVRECGVLGIPLAVVQAAGFAETGDTAAQEELSEVARSAGVLVIGPNCIGFFGESANINLTTLPDLPRGGVVMISQSGGLVSHVGRRLRQLRDGFTGIMSLGNKIDVDITDCLNVLEREEPRSVLLYLESFDEGERMLDAVARVRDTSPVTVLLGGRSRSGRDAARSHTASMFGEWSRIAALLTEAGAHVCDRLESAVAAASGRPSLLNGRRVFVLCDGGGHSVLLGDACEGAGLRLSTPSPDLADRVAERIGRPVGAVRNPLDVAGAADTDPSIYASVFDVVARSGEYDACLVGGFFGGHADIFGPATADAELDTAKAIGGIADHTSFRAVVQTTYGVEDTAPLRALRADGVAVLEWPSEAAEWLAARAPEAGREPARSATEGSNVDVGLGARVERIRTYCSSIGLMDGVGVLTERGDLARLPTTGTWVLRLDDVLHKARVGAVRVGVEPPALQHTYDELVTLATTLGIEPRVRVAPYVPHEHELIVTLWHDTASGSGIVVGGGGSGVELANDVTVGRLPRSEHDVERLLRRTRAGSAVLDQAPQDVARQLASAITRLAAAMDDELEPFAEVELNPLVVGPAGVAVLDVVAADRQPSRVRRSRQTVGA